MSDDEIDALSTPERWATVFAPAIVAALELADAMSSESGAIEADVVAEVRSHWNDDELAELMLVCGQPNFNNRVGNAAKHLLVDDRPSRADR